MTPKEKAIELFNKMCDYKLDHSDAKRCALIAVDEILEATKTKYKWGGGSPERLVHFEEVKYDTYWKEVKQELEKL